jgi:hypothetical protein
VRFLVPCLLLALAVPTLSQPAAGAAGSPLEILPTEGVTKRGDNYARYDFGKVEAIASTVLRRSLALRNDSSAPLEIAYVQVTCGCSSAILEGGGSPGGNGTPRKLAPGEKATLQVTVDLGKLQPGHINKFAYVYVQGRGEPAATFEIEGTLLPSIVFRPAFAPFQQVPYGKGATLRMLALLDARALPPGGSLTPYSTLPEVKVAPVEPTPAEVQAATRPASLPDGLKGKNVVVRAFTLTLAREAPISLLQGAIGFASPHGDTEGSGATPRSRLVAAVTKVNLPVVGEVVGDVSADPPSLLFGAVGLGKGASRPVTLTGSKPETLEGAQVTGQGQWLEARITPTPGNRKKAVLNISVRPNAPSMYLYEKVTVTLRNGQRLVLPVAATISGGG